LGPGKTHGTPPRREIRQVQDIPQGQTPVLSSSDRVVVSKHRYSGESLPLHVDPRIAQSNGGYIVIEINEPVREPAQSRSPCRDFGVAMTGMSYGAALTFFAVNILEPENDTNHALAGILLTVGTLICAATALMTKRN